MAANTEMVRNLRSRELPRLARPPSYELGLNFVETRNGDQIEGVVKRHVDLAQGRFALIERQIGKQAGGIMRDGGVSWTIGRGRGGPVIS